jgi:hypothetical protein
LTLFGVGLTRILCRKLFSARNRLKAARSGATPDPGAERIKALKSAHCIESALRRLSTLRTTAAEEPVTARIRQRIGQPAVSSPPASSPGGQGCWLS